ncbi:dihydrofolate reductase family protein [Saccharopolyspora griseoalba]|uniref:Dihydrofolate reductase family protein n=1 Tax=Saccharopolyspora griseoalba TaxID=1431848 RepID=A0ABW2LJ09_9PSEU
MRELTYLIASTIDGRITVPDNGNPDFFRHDGDHGEFLLAEYPEIIPTHARSSLGLADAPHEHFDTVLQGRGSWEIGMRCGITNAYRHLRSIVFSRSVAESPDPSVEFVAADPVERVRELKRQEGAGIWPCGGGKLAAALRSEIDELVVKLHPVVAGAGIPMFDGEFLPEHLALTGARPFADGIVHLTYARR